MFLGSSQGSVPNGRSKQDSSSSLNAAFAERRVKFSLGREEEICRGLQCCKGSERCGQTGVTVQKPLGRQKHWLLREL